MTERVEYFGTPGQCYSIDGDWWHEPGSVTVDPGFERWLREGGVMPDPSPVRCCGVVDVDDMLAAARAGEVQR